MSAFQITDEHIATIAAAILDLSDEDLRESMQVLHVANIRTIEACERLEAAEVLPMGFSLAKARMLGRTTPALHVLSLLACYEYQSNGAADWKSSEAYRLVNTIRSAAIGRLPGFEDAPFTI